MIVGDCGHNEQKVFERVLSSSIRELINRDANGEVDFNLLSPTNFEEVAYESIVRAAKNTVFENNVELISGYRFPDIVSRTKYGVEVKSKKSNNSWRTTGNSVLESTRLEGVKSIYILFGKLSKPFDARIRRYEDVLYEIVVTHSPRYLIDMDLETEDSIFSKMGISYDCLRTKSDPIKWIRDYYRNTLKEGETLWWVESDEEYVDNPQKGKPVIRLWETLDAEFQTELIIDAFVNFPILLSKSTTKYKDLAMWLVSEHLVVSSSLRDNFSAGGKVTINIDKIDFTVPRIFEKFYANIADIIIRVKSKKDFRSWRSEVLSYTSEYSDKETTFLLKILK